MIRVKFLVPRVLVLVGALVVVRITGNHLAQSFIARSLERVTGAEVNVGPVRASLTEGRIEIKDIQLADPGDPWRNILQAEYATLTLDCERLLYGQVVVEDGQLYDVQFRTPRLRDGSLGRQPSSSNRNLLVAGQHAEPVALNWGAVPNDRSLLTPIDLAALSSGELATKQLAREVTEKWNRWMALPRRRAELIGQRIAALRDSMEGASQNPLRQRAWREGVLSELTAVREEIDTVQRDLDQAHRQMELDCQRLRQAADADIQRAISREPPDATMARQLDQYLLEQDFTERFSEILNWVRDLRDRFPNPPQDFAAGGGRGTTVPLLNQPHWIVKHADVFGRTRLAGHAFEYRGTASNLTDRPAQLAEPFRLELHALGPTNLHVTAELDRRGAQRLDTISIVCPRMLANQHHWGGPQLLLRQGEAGYLAWQADLTIVDDVVQGRVRVRRFGLDLELDRVQFANHEPLVRQLADSGIGPARMVDLRGQPAPAPLREIGAAIDSRIGLVDEYCVEADLRGPWDSIVVSAKSDLGQQVAQAIDRAVNETCSAWTAAQVAELQRIRDEELAELQQSFATFVADIDQRLADVERISRYIAEMPTNNIR
jgi:uncharacterized protein (TIGR03545 family)